MDFSGLVDLFLGDIAGAILLAFVPIIVLFGVLGAIKRFLLQVLT